MEVDASELYYWDEETMEETFDQGTYQIFVGSSSEDIRLEGSFSLSGTLNKTLQTVTAIPDKTSLDAAEPENQVTTKLSAAMNDQSFCDLDEAVVTYSSSNEDVAAVDRNGIVTPVGKGTALITASVTVDGVTMTDSYPVAVKQEILDVVEQEDTDFNEMNSLEDLSAAGWEIIRPDDSNPVTIENGSGLVIQSERGDLYQNQNTARNLVAKELEGDWTATIHMTADIIPTQRYQQAGVLIYGDDDNFIKLADIFDGKTSAQVQFGQEEDGTWTQIIEPYDSSRDYYFRIEKVGAQYKASYSTDGESFQVLGTAIQEFANPKLALFAFNGEQTADPMTATFIDVVFEELKVNCTCGLYDLEFLNGTEISYRDGIEGIELQTGLKTRRGCQIRGHLDNEIKYQYAVSDTGENTANAVIEGNVLKAANAGKVTVEVTAVWNEVEETIEKEFIILENDSEAVDKTALESAVNAVKDYAEADYTAASWEAFAKALSEAQAVLADNLATDDAVASAKTALENASAALVNIAALKAKVADMKAVDTEGYTEESVKALQDAIADAEKLYGEGTAAEVKAAIRALDDAKAGLEKEEVLKLPYEDVQEDEWFYDYVYDVYEKDLMKGLNDSTFGPAQNLVRAQFAVIVYRMEGSPEVKFDAKKFPDVAAGQFYSEAVIWAAENGIVTGYTSNGHFGPNDPITREQMAAMMFRYANYKKLDTSEKEKLSAFPDGSSVQAFAKDAMEWCTAKGIISGKGNEPKILDPQGSTNRAECATIISRYTNIK